MDEHEHVEPAEKDGVDMKEVAGDQALRLRSQELRPSRSQSPRRRLDAVTLQDRPDARGGDDNAHGGELTVDAAVAPGRVLLRQPEDERGGSPRGTRPTGTAVGIGPALGDEVPVPAQQGRRLDEEVPETLASEQSCQSCPAPLDLQARAPVGGLGVGGLPPRGAARRLRWRGPYLCER